MASILVIEDDPLFMSMISQMLQQSGHAVSEAGDGVAGVQMYRTHRPDLVITDILMPAKDGIETIIELRRIDPGARIVAMSGGRRNITPRFNLDSAALVGVREVLAKPFSRQALLQAIDHALA